MTATFGMQVIAIGHKRSMTRTGHFQATEGVAPGEGHACFSLLMPRSISASVWSALAASPTTVCAGEDEWQHIRIKQGETQLYIEGFIRTEPKQSVLLDK